MAVPIFNQSLRQVDTKSTPLMQMASGSNSAAVISHILFAASQPYAGTGKFTASVESMEHLEDTAQVLLGRADTIIFYVDPWYKAT